MDKIADSVVLATLKKIADANPEYVYAAPEGADPNECVYSTPDGAAASCIVGHVLKELDPALFEKIVKAEWQDVEDEDGEVHKSAFSFAITEARFQEGIELDAIPFTDEALRLLETAQGLQDVKVPWGRAVEEAARDCEYDLAVD